MSYHNSAAVRNALFQVFVLPNLSNLPRTAGALVKNRHIVTPTSRRAIVRPPPPHPDVIVHPHIFRNVSLVPSTGETGTVQPGVPLYSVHERMESHNKTVKDSDKRQYLVMLQEPVWRYGDEPDVNLLLAYLAPQKLIQSIRKATGQGAPLTPAVNPRLTLRLPPIPPPQKEPVVKIMTKNELRQLLEKKSQQLKQNQKVTKKELELTWTVDDNDLQHAYKKMRVWLEEGLQVQVKVVRKQRRINPPPESCIRVLQSLRNFANEIPGLPEPDIKRLRKKSTEETSDTRDSENDDPMLGIGHSMQLTYFPASKVAKSSTDVEVKIPWRINDSQFKLHLHTITSALKKGKNLRIELAESEEAAKVKGLLTPETVFVRVRSACRQSKDTRIKATQGTIESGNVVFVVQGGLKSGKNREVEISSDATQKILDSRTIWIDEWTTADQTVTVWPTDSQDSNLLVHLQTALAGKCSIETAHDSKTDEVKHIIKRLPKEQQTSVEPPPRPPAPPASAVPPVWKRTESDSPWNSEAPRIRPSREREMSDLLDSVMGAGKLSRDRGAFSMRALLNEQRGKREAQGWGWAPRRESQAGGSG